MHLILLNVLTTNKTKAREKQKVSDVALIRVEELYPYPHQDVVAELKKYPKSQIIWCQEEPENMGAWTYILRKFRKDVEEGIFRRSSASPATGFSKIHNDEQQKIVNQAFAE